MTAGWNFERRRDTCARFLIGVADVVSHLADKDTSLERVRHRMRLSPEEALFAARKLDEEHLIGFDPVGPVRSTARGIERAATLMQAVRDKVGRHAEVEPLLRAGGTPLAVVAAVIRANGEPLPCGGPETDPDARYRLALVGEEVVLEREAEDGTFTTVRLE